MQFNETILESFKLYILCIENISLFWLYEIVINFNIFINSIIDQIHLHCVNYLRI